MAFMEIEVLFLLLLLFLLLAFDRQAALGELHLNIFLVNPRKVGSELIGVIRLDNVDSGSATPFQLTPPEWLDIESRAPEGAPEIPVKILKKSVDLTAQAFERAPCLRLGRALRSLLLFYGHFACSFIHFPSSSRIGICVAFEKYLYCAKTKSSRGFRKHEICGTAR
jgi:hypothetical protein